MLQEAGIYLVAPSIIRAGPCFDYEFQEGDMDHAIQVYSISADFARRTNRLKATFHAQDPPCSGDEETSNPFGCDRHAVVAQSGVTT